MPNYIHAMNSSLSSVFRDALKVSGTFRGFFFLLHTFWRQYQAIQRRQYWEKQNIQVPPFMIVSITSQCNLKCQGCYAQAHERKKQSDMDDRQMAKLFNEASELGIAVILIAGGEPLLRPEIFTLTKNHPEIIFPVFTNGLKLKDDLLKTFIRQPQLIPIISIEGTAEQTDQRRGTGVYANFQNTALTLKKHSLFFGVSLTIKQNNFDTITAEKFIESIVKLGCKIFFFIEYIPVQNGTEKMVLTTNQKSKLLDIMKSLRKKFPALFIAFPGDEEQFGGCLAAGRGFIHINVDGSVEPCPFSPYADVNLKQASLREALDSKLLATIRENHQKLTEAQSGCALWENQDWVRSLLK